MKFKLVSQRKHLKKWEIKTYKELGFDVTDGGFIKSDVEVNTQNKKDQFYSKSRSDIKQYLRDKLKSPIIRHPVIWDIINK